MSQTVVITGVTGFVGMRIAEAALNAGYRVRATVRNLDQAEKVRGFIAAEAETDALDFYPADLLSDDGWDAAFEGADYVIHAASPLILGNVADEKILMEPAIQGTRRVLAASLRQGIKKVVLTSTALTAAAHITEGDVTPEDFTPIEASGVNPYTKSKILAEQEVMSFAKANPDGPELVSILPGVIIGPPLNRDEDSESIGLFKGIWSGAQPLVPDISFPLADVRDVAAAHVNALTANTGPMSRFLVSFTTYPQRLIDIAFVLRESGNKKAPKRVIPRGVLRILALFNSELRSLVQSTEGLTMRLDSSKTREVLSWTPREFKQSVLDTAEALER